MASGFGAGLARAVLSLFDMLLPELQGAGILEDDSECSTTSASSSAKAAVTDERKRASDVEASVHRTQGDIYEQ